MSKEVKFIKIIVRKKLVKSREIVWKYFEKDQNNKDYKTICERRTLQFNVQ